MEQFRPGLEVGPLELRRQCEEELGVGEQLCAVALGGGDEAVESGLTCSEVVDEAALRVGLEGEGGGGLLCGPLEVGEGGVVDGELALAVDGGLVVVLEEPDGEGGGLAGLALAAGQVELDEVELGVAHEPADGAVPEAGVAAAAVACEGVFEAPLPALVGGDGHGAALAHVGDGDDRHGVARGGLERGVGGEDGGAVACVADEVGAEHGGELFPLLAVADGVELDAGDRVKQAGGGELRDEGGEVEAGRPALVCRELHRQDLFDGGAEVAALGEGAVAPDHDHRAAVHHIVVDAVEVGRHAVGPVVEVVEEDEVEGAELLVEELFCGEGDEGEFALRGLRDVFLRAQDEEGDELHIGVSAEELAHEAAVPAG